ncbi:TetR/AcrR family transcriptional regulator [Actinoplanes sp. NPDC051470]|uniref:TetR/AcrR family transcriptional regulator n=1 Tax=Actinoplanes sp. NPDC051470 TaxID=3157224 RepID=UPI003419809D
MLTRDQIVRAAIEVLDAEGVAGLNMRRLGAQLGSAATAMYHHVESKEQLVVLAADHVFSEIALPDLHTTKWRDAAAALARGAYAMITQHFWLIPAMSTHLIYGPGKARYDEHCLTVYETAGFSEQDADQAAATVLMFVIGAALGEVAQSAWRARLRHTGMNEEEQLHKAIAYIHEVAQQFPRLRARASSRLDAITQPTEPAFEFGLRTVLDGLEAQIR